MTAPLPVSLALFLAQAAGDSPAPAPATTAAPAATVTTATGTPAPAVPAPGAPTPGSALTQFVPFLFIAVIFYFLLIRPQQLRAKQQAALVNSIKSGDEVLTNSGIYGTVTNVNPERKTVTVRIADNVKVIMSREAVTTVLNRTADAAGSGPATVAAR